MQSVHDCEIFKISYPFVVLDSSLCPWDLNSLCISPDLPTSSCGPSRWSFWKTTWIWALMEPALRLNGLGNHPNSVKLSGTTGCWYANSLWSSHLRHFHSCMKSKSRSLLSIAQVCSNLYYLLFMMINISLK